MSSISVRLEGDTENLLARLRFLGDVDRAGVMNAIAEGIRTSTVQRFRTEEGPDGRKWKPSVRALETGGKTLTGSAGSSSQTDTQSSLKTSIHAQADATGAAVGTNLVYAATHQFGDERTVRAKNGGYLRFQIGGRWVTKASVRIQIPARPFLGISEADEAEIRDILEEAFAEQ